MPSTPVQLPIDCLDKQPFEGVERKKGLFLSVAKHRQNQREKKSESTQNDENDFRMILSNSYSLFFEMYR